MKSYREGSVDVLVLSGRFDAHASLDAAKWLNDHVVPGRVAVDLSDVNFIDSSGIGALVLGMKRCRAQGGDVRLFGLRQPVQIIFELTRLDRAFEIYASRDAALAAFGQ